MLMLMTVFTLFSAAQGNAADDAPRTRHGF
jgi:hypothetical protein